MADLFQMSNDMRVERENIVNRDYENNGNSNAFIRYRTNSVLTQY